MKQLMRISYYGGIVALACLSATAQATVVLYDQNFENPTGFVNDGGDVNIFRTVNQLYGNQPPGFTFAQANTVETLYINGTAAFGTGYSDPSGKGGNYALGMLSSTQNDLLGLAFDVGTFDYLNVRLDISSIDLSVFGGPFVAPGAVPVFSFTLYDNPTGATALGGGTPLASAQATGTASARDVFDWTEVILGLDATGSTVSAPRTPFFLSSLRRDQLLSLEIPRQEGLEVFDGGRGGQGAQHVAQPQIRLEAVGLGGFDQRVDERAGTCAGLRIREEPRLSADHEGADGVFGRVVVDRQIAALEVADQARPLSMQVAQRTPEHRGGRHGGEHVVEPAAQFIDNGAAAGLT